MSRSRFTICCMENHRIEKHISNDSILLRDCNIETDAYSSGCSHDTNHDFYQHHGALISVSYLQNTNLLLPDP